MNKTLLYVVLGIVIVALLGGGAFMVINNAKPKTIPSTTSTITKNSATTAATPATTKDGWKEVGPAFAGTYADTSIVALADGTYRMYTGVQPEVAGNKLEVFSATSKDGITWTKEAGNRKTMATFPEVLKLDDGTYRMYFQNAGVIKSATSKDGLTFTDEAGTRIDITNDAGITLDNVAAPAVLKLNDGSYIMVYRGSINSAYTAETVPNKTMGVLMWATSTDGKTWTKKGLAVDTRTSTELKGWADGPALVDFDGEIRLYFSTYAGIYSSVFSNNSFSTPKFSWTLTQKSNTVIGIPPGDPALLKVDSTWYMYFGRHPEGIYYATQSK